MRAAAIIVFATSLQTASGFAPVSQIYSRTLHLGGAKHIGSRSLEIVERTSPLKMVSVQSSVASVVKRLGSNPLKSMTLEQATGKFPAWVALASLVGIVQPALLTWFVPFITPALALTMIFMGMTLTLDDFKGVIKTPKYPLIGFVCQFTIMPMMALFFGKLYGLRTEFATGLQLVGSVPGGTASNIVSLIAGADVALSVLMTALSTVCSIFMTPFLVTKFVGKNVVVNSMELLVSTANVVLLPVLIGLYINSNKSTKYISDKLSKYTPFMSVALVSLICGSVSATNSKIFLSSFGDTVRLILAIISLHSAGFGLGYAVPKYLLKADEKKSRTISIETGMQNSALAVVLSRSFADPALVGLAGAISATTHSMIGSALAARWRQAPAAKKVYSVGKRYW